MKIEDIKPGMRVIYNKGGVSEDKGTVLDRLCAHTGNFYVKWDSDGDERHVTAEWIEPVVEKVIETPHFGFKVNHGGIKKVQKMVEFEEIQPDTYTIALSRSAAQELRALVGGMHCGSGSALYLECRELLDYFEASTDKLRLKAPANISSAHFEPWK